mgnify:CR=1 FL=1
MFHRTIQMLQSLFSGSFTCVFMCFCLFACAWEVVFICVCFVCCCFACFFPLFSCVFCAFYLWRGFVVVFFWHAGGRSTSFFRCLERYINCPYSGFVRIAVLSVLRFCPFSGFVRFRASHAITNAPTLDRLPCYSNINKTHKTLKVLSLWRIFTNKNSFPVIFYFVSNKICLN